MKNFLLFFIALLFFTTNITAQTEADSSSFLNAEWKIISKGDGYICKKANLNLFGNPQQITYAIVDTSVCKLKLYSAPHKKAITLDNIAKSFNNAVLVINGSFFDTKTYEPANLLKVDGKVLDVNYMWGVGENILALDSNGSASIYKVNGPLNEKQEVHHEVLACEPLLIVKNKLVKYNTPTVAPRSAIGLKEGASILMVVDGRRRTMHGVSMEQTAWIMSMLGCNDALNLDGGGSSSIWVKSVGIVNSPSDIFGTRPVPNAIVVLKKNNN